MPIGLILLKSIRHTCRESRFKSRQSCFVLLMWFFCCVGVNSHSFNSLEFGMLEIWEKYWGISHAGSHNRIRWLLTLIDIVKLQQRCRVRGEWRQRKKLISGHAASILVLCTATEALFVRTIETNNISRNYSRWRRLLEKVTDDDSYLPFFSLQTLIALATTHLTQQKHSFNHGLERWTLSHFHTNNKTYENNLTAQMG